MDTVSRKDWVVPTGSNRSETIANETVESPTQRPGVPTPRPKARKDSLSAGGATAFPGFVFRSACTEVGKATNHWRAVRIRP